MTGRQLSAAVRNGSPNGICAQIGERTRISSRVDAEVLLDGGLAGVGLLALGEFCFDVI